MKTLLLEQRMLSKEMEIHSKQVKVSSEEIIM